MTATISTFPSLAAPGNTPVDAVRAWYCLRVAARREQIAARNLTQRTGLAIFAPRIRLRKTASGKGTDFVTEALFPGYIFARFRYPHEARHVASTPGVLGVVAFGGPPPAVPDHVVNHLNAEVQRALLAPPTPEFPEGSWVRIAAGCFRGNEGRVLQGGSAALRISVLMNLLGQDVQVNVPVEHVTPGTTEGRNTFPAGLRTCPRPTSPSQS